MMDNDVVWQGIITADMVNGWASDKISLLIRELDDLVYITYEEMSSDTNVEGLFDNELE
jgi:hypothetical protein